MPRPIVAALLALGLSSPAFAEDCGGVAAVRGQIESAFVEIENARASLHSGGSLADALAAAKTGVELADAGLTAEPALATVRDGAHERIVAALKSIAKAQGRLTKRGYVRKRLAAASKSLRSAASAVARFEDDPDCGVTLNGDLDGLQVFPTDNWWNEDVTGRAVAADSDAVIDFIGRTRSLHADFGTQYGIPYVVLDAPQTLSPVTFLYDDESDAGAPGRAPGYPIPRAARTTPGFIEGGVAGGGNSGDRHLLLVDRTSNLLWELYATKWDGQSWAAGSGAVFDLASNARRPEGWTSADAAGLAIFPGLARHDEAVTAGEIRHALRFTCRATQGYVYPASHDATHGAGGDARPPLGLRVRLKAGVDLSAMSAPGRAIFTAMKKYGLILADNGSDWYVTGATHPGWDDDALHDDFARVTGNDLEVVAPQ